MQVDGDAADRGGFLCVFGVAKRRKRSEMLSGQWM
jgi:hypothetical protein